LEYNKNSPLVLSNLANSLLELQQIDEAIVILQKGLLITANFGPLHSGLCVAFARKGDWERVIHHGELSLGFDPSFQPQTCYNHMAFAYKEMGNHDKANIYLQKAKEAI